MSKKTGSRRVSEISAGLSQYWDESKKPLTILAFLLPLIVLYEIGLAVLLRSDRGVLTNKAHETLLNIFQTLGVAPTSGLYLGGVVIVVVLLLWHLLNRDPWKLNKQHVLLMYLEAAILTLPLLAAAQFISQSLVAAAGAGTAETLSSVGIAPGLMISVGAGLYEELMFRMLLIAVLHTLLVDVAKASHSLGAGIAILLSAMVFTWYHDLSGPGGGLSAPKIVFYMIAGLYFGIIYVVRGFGIVVAVHAFYDVITISLLQGPGASQ